ncbi:hypothetical protein DRH27_05755, partial [Candidatus Falkowbacteria bacterium]
KKVIEILTGKEPASQETSAPTNELLLIRVCSPVDIMVISPSGQRLGKDFAGAGEHSEIAGGFYSGFDTEMEFITIPNPEDGGYTISLQGMEDGLYRVGVDLLADDLPDTQELLIPGISSEDKVENFTFNIIEECQEQPELIKEISFSGLILDLEALNSAGEILKKQAYNSLGARLAGLEKRYEKMSEKKSGWQMEIQKKRIISNLKLIKTQLKTFKDKNWISTDAFNILIYDIDSLIKQL